MATRREALLSGLTAVLGGGVGAAMSDRPDFERSQDIANQTLSEQETAITTEQQIEVVQRETVKTADIPSFSSEIVEFAPGPDAVYSSVSISFLVGSPGGSGAHTIEFGTSKGPEFTPVSAAYPAGQSIRIDMNEFTEPGDANTVYPGSAAARVANVQAIQVDNDSQVQFLYENLTGTTQTKQREYRILATRRKIA